MKVLQIGDPRRAFRHKITVLKLTSTPLLKTYPSLSNLLQRQTLQVCTKLKVLKEFSMENQINASAGDCIPRWGLKSMTAEFVRIVGAISVITSEARQPEEKCHQDRLFELSERQL